MLPNRTRRGSGWNPPLPLILAGWWDSSPRQKKERFLEHLAWAQREGVVDAVVGVLRTLGTADWYLVD
jgi:hypothetical protein